MSANPNSTFSLDKYPLSTWVFSGHCESTSPFIQETLENSNRPTLATAIKYMRDSLPPDFDRSAISELDLDKELIGWLRTVPLPQEYVELATDSCRVDICRLLDWPGEPDTSGVGVSISITLWVSYGRF